MEGKVSTQQDVGAPAIPPVPSVSEADKSDTGELFQQVSGSVVDIMNASAALKGAVTKAMFESATKE